MPFLLSTAVSTRHFIKVIWSTNYREGVTGMAKVRTHYPWRWKGANEPKCFLPSYSLLQDLSPAIGVYTCQRKCKSGYKIQILWTSPNNCCDYRMRYKSRPFQFPQPTVLNIHAPILFDFFGHQCKLRMYRFNLTDNCYWMKVSLPTSPNPESIKKHTAFKIDNSMLRVGISLGYKVKKKLILLGNH